MKSSHARQIWVQVFDHVPQLFSLTLCLYVKKKKTLYVYDEISQSLTQSLSVTSLHLSKLQTATAATPGVSNPKMKTNIYIFSLGFGSSNYFSPQSGRGPTLTRIYLFMNLHRSWRKYCTASDNLFPKCISARNYA